MQKKNILVSAFSNLTTDQRIEKVCKTLSENGYKIELIGNDYGCNKKVDRPYPTCKIPVFSKSLKTAYFEFNWKLYSLLLKKADKNTILFANDIDALLPNYLVSKKLNLPLVFDSHEIFTEMPAIQGKLSQKIWRLVEGKLVPKIEFMMTESESYAEWFQQKYAVKPIVVRNIPRRINTIDSIPDNNPKIILYQGAINQSRGIDKAILSMKYLQNAIFKIVGDGPKRKEYEELATKENLLDKVSFLGKKTPEELREITKTADVGVSLEENGGVSYLYSLPNKVADYIQSCVPLVMINFPEMLRVKSEFNVGEVITNHNPETIAEAIKKVLDIGRKSYQEELENAAKFLCWENEEAKILQLIEKASLSKK